ncbi:uncharacterized protein LOC131614216 [Vicia villosa]|uniref:uncharacterized protein LOC131614216 n=1 Tax=Vicia villosa TaxID=3911 RepID=UPI00273BC5E3|nr:uncharacterized protein LOC131614216 [Vicia villosa]
MVHPDVFPKHIVSLDASRVVVKKIRTKASKLGFRVVIRRYDNGTDKRGAFMTLTCERSGKYTPLLHNFKRNETGLGKRDCPYKFHDYRLENHKWIFNVICGLHNHDLCEKLAGPPIARRLMPEEKKPVCDMTLNLVQVKNILVIFHIPKSYPFLR